MDHNKILINDYLYDCQQDFLGSGSFGKVYKGQNLKTKEIVAIKVLDMKLFNDPFMIQSLKNEIQIMRQLSSKHIVRMLDVFESNSRDQTYMIIEYCPQGDLRKFLKTNNGHLKEDLARNVLLQLMDGFKELIAKNYIHRDIKPENALVSGNTHKVADFGFATKVDISGRQLIKECVGTPLYMAPQLLQNHPYTAKSDIWSIGLLYYEMLFGKTPWSCRDQLSYLKNIESQPLKFPYDRPISDQSKDFLKRCLVVGEQNRIGWGEIFNHPLLHSSTQSQVYQNPSKHHFRLTPVQPSFVLDIESKLLLRKLQSIALNYHLDPMQIFQNFDKDKNNILDPQEFLQVFKKIYDQLLRTLNPNITSTQSQNLYMALSQKKQYLDFSEFKKIFCEMDFCDLNDKAEHLIVDLKQIIKANNYSISKIFLNFDIQRDGHLDIKEFAQLLRRIAPALKDDDIELVFNKFDSNHDRIISYDEFRMAIGGGIEQSQNNPVLVRAKQIREQMRQLFIQHNVNIAQVFAKFDKQNQKRIDKNECFRLFGIVDQNITQREASALFHLFDEDGSGYVTFDEFRKQIQG